MSELERKRYAIVTRRPAITEEKRNHTARDVFEEKRGKKKKRRKRSEIFVHVIVYRALWEEREDKRAPVLVKHSYAKTRPRRLHPIDIETARL